MFILATGEISRAFRSMFQSKSAHRVSEGLITKDLSEIRAAGKKLRPTKKDIYGPKFMSDELERQMTEKSINEAFGWIEI